MLCGGTFELTLAHAGVSIRCLQLWIKRFNQAGIDGITYRPKTGRPRLMESAEISEKILPIVDDPKLADRHHWTAIALCGWLKDNKELVLSYRTLVRYLHEQDYARRIPRPMPEPPDKDKWLKQREAFLPQLAKLYEDEQVDRLPKVLSETRRIGCWKSMPLRGRWIRIPACGIRWLRDSSIVDVHGFRWDLPPLKPHFHGELTGLFGWTTSLSPVGAL